METVLGMFMLPIVFILIDMFRPARATYPTRTRALWFMGLTVLFWIFGLVWAFLGEAAWWVRVLIVLTHGAVPCLLFTGTESRAGQGFVFRLFYTIGRYIVCLIWHIVDFIRCLLGGEI